MNNPVKGLNLTMYKIFGEVPKVIYYRATFFAAKWKDGHKIDNLIDVWTLIANLPRVMWQTKLNFKEIKKFYNMNFAHVEIWTPNECCVHPRPCDWWNGTMWTSTMRDEDDGTVHRPVKDVIKDASRWWQWEIKAPSKDMQLALMYGYNEVVNNEGYSKRDISKFFPVVRHLVPNEKIRNICSEFSYRFMTIATFFKKFKLVSPRLMAWEIYRETGTLPVQVQESK